MHTLIYCKKHPVLKCLLRIILLYNRFYFIFTSSNWKLCRMQEIMCYLFYDFMHLCSLLCLEQSIRTCIVVLLSLTKLLRAWLGQVTSNAAYYNTNLYRLFTCGNLYDRALASLFCRLAVSPSVIDDAKADHSLICSYHDSGDQFCT